MVTTPRDTTFLGTYYHPKVVFPGIQGCFMVISWLYLGCFKDGSRNFHEFVKEISGILKRKLFLREFFGRYFKFLCYNETTKAEQDQN